MFGYPSTQVTGQFRSKYDFLSSGRARSDVFDPAKPKSTRKSDQKYPNIPGSILYDPEFDVDSKSAVKKPQLPAITSYSPRLKSRVKPPNSKFRPDPTEPNRYLNSPSNSDTENPNLYPGEHYPPARTNPNG